MSTTQTFSVHSVIQSITMFFVGAGIGIIMNAVFQIAFQKCEPSFELVLSVFQLFLVAILIAYFSSRVESMGLFVSGLLMAQELYITRLLPKRRNKEEKKTD